MEAILGLALFFGFIYFMVVTIARLNCDHDWKLVRVWWDREVDKYPIKQYDKCRKCGKKS